MLSRVFDYARKRPLLHRHFTFGQIAALRAALQVRSNVIIILPRTDLCHVPADYIPLGVIFNDGDEGIVRTTRPPVPLAATQKTGRDPMLTKRWRPNTTSIAQPSASGTPEKARRIAHTALMRSTPRSHPHRKRSWSPYEKRYVISTQTHKLLEYPSSALNCSVMASVVSLFSVHLPISCSNYAANKKWTSSV